MEDIIRNLTVDEGKLAKDLKLEDLKAELEKRGLSKLGTKKDLLKRLAIVSC